MITNVAPAGDELGEEAEKGQLLLKELREALHVMCPNPLVLPEQRVGLNHSCGALSYFRKCSCLNRWSFGRYVCMKRGYYQTKLGMISLAKVQLKLQMITPVLVSLVQKQLCNDTRQEAGIKSWYGISHFCFGYLTAEFLDLKPVYDVSCSEAHETSGHVFGTRLVQQERA